MHEPHPAERFVVVTGGPGSGKTTVLDRLRQDGFVTTTEAGRGIIQDQVAIGGQALPWKDQELFAETMLSWEIRSYRTAQQHSDVVLFDRGVPDVAGYRRLCGLPVPTHMSAAADMFRYNARVFIAPPWPEIFEQDSERSQDFHEAERTYQAMAHTYTNLGYELLTLPTVDVDSRARFVIEQTTT